ncbi:flagellar protein FlaG [Rheinheimera maricola]|uniref:Flagellar protein FlaG n=1 Tax=Rheinheimera maricola TaxID=2793282 RepID=A0ABS7X3R9_9GAMM|nr:flagellar protein FlaG [Rheinheimera maricola]MBZ9610208.1 flagellar protein FlaG [Rheinheimera maricola]
MSVDTLAIKDNRLVDLALEKPATANSANAKIGQTESVLNQQRKIDDVDDVKNSDSMVKSVTELAEDTVAAITFDSNQIRQTLEQINKVIPITNTRLVFEFDELGDPPVIKVIDKTSNELIREIPSQDLVKVAKAFSEMADNLTKAGALINFQA